MNLLLYLLSCGFAAGIIFVLIAIIYQYTFWKRRKVLHIDVFPLLGQNKDLFSKTISFFEFSKKLYFQYEDAKYYGSFDLNCPVVILKDPELIRDICIKNFESFPDHRSFVTEEMDPVIGKNVFSLTGHRWKEVRSTLSPSFTANKMKFMFRLIEECSRNFIDYFVKNKDFAREFDVKDAFTRYTNDVIATAAFGVDVNSMKNKNNEFYLTGLDALNFEKATRLLKFIFFRLCPNLMRNFGIRFLSNKTDKFFKDLIYGTVQAREDQGIVRPDMVQLLMQAKNKENGIEFTTDDIVGQAFIFFLAGFDTSATLMCLVCHELAANPDIQERLREEIDEKFDENAEVSYDSLVNLKYLDMVINETLRMYPPAVLMDRLCVKEYELPPARPGDKPLKIQPGMNIQIPVVGLHHDLKYFPNPEKFDPERFNDENKNNIDPCIYIPFGLGPRKCIGNRFALMETKILIIHILQKFVIKFTKKSQHPIEFSKRSFQIVPEGGFWLNFEERKKVE